MQVSCPASRVLPGLPASRAGLPSANRGAGHLAAEGQDGARQGGGWGGEVGHMCPHGVGSWVEVQEKTSVVTAVQMDRGVEPGEEARHQKAPSIKALSPCPAAEMGLWGRETSQEQTKIQGPLPT